LTSRNQDMTLLETILRELDEAIVVCDRQGLILLCNPAARLLFRQHRAMVPGRSLFEVCNRAPIAHALEILQSSGRDGRWQPATDLVCATVDNEILLRCRIRQLAAPETGQPILLFTFAELDPRLAGRNQAAQLLQATFEGMRPPLTNLVAAADSLKGHPEMSPEIRRAFEEVVHRESGELAGRFDSLLLEYRALNRQPWPLADVNSADLLGCLARRLAGAGEATLNVTGVPLWLRADSYALLLTLEILVRFVLEKRGLTEIDLEALLGDRRVYLDIVWPGEPIAQGDLDRVLQSSLPFEGGGVTVAEVLFRHDSELWSQRHRRDGFSLLRLPLPDSPRQWQTPARLAAERGEFHDFSLACLQANSDKFADWPLSALDYVVFDTETTGLQPAAGDEILAIGAVRLAQGRILSSESFAQPVKPQGPIPAGSLPFLDLPGPTADREAPIGEVLPRFKSFVGEAVLVAHNGGFDLNFFRSLEAATGVRIDNPLLDTLLLSLLLDERRTDHTLPGLARWLGVEIPGDRTLMDDCFATARIFLRLLELLAERGLTTLGQLLVASNRLVEKKRAEAETGRENA
jgi:DNA polymerase-3 subunit epsilon